MVSNRTSGENLTDLMIKIGRFQFLIIGFIFCGFLLLGRPFIHLWIGAEYDDSWVIAVALMASLVIPLSSNSGMFILLAKNKHSFRAILYLLVALFNFVLSIFLAEEIGALGVALGTSISLIVNTGIINIYYHRVIKLNILRFLKEFKKGILASLLFSLGGTKLLMFLFEFETSWFSLIIYVLIFSFLYAIILWFYGTNEYERNLVTTSLKMLKKNLNDKYRVSAATNN